MLGEREVWPTCVISSVRQHTEGDFEHSYAGPIITCPCAFQNFHWPRFLSNILSSKLLKVRSPWLRQTKDLLDLTAVAADDSIGHVKDRYFDDKAWAIR